jgi:hypothetical protein
MNPIDVRDKEWYYPKPGDSDSKDDTTKYQDGRHGKHSKALIENGASDDNNTGGFISRNFNSFRWNFREQANAAKVQHGHLKAHFCRRGAVVEPFHFSR